MTKTILAILSVLVVAALVACSPSPQVIQTAIAQTEAAKPASAPVAVSTSVPSSANVPAPTNTPVPTDTVVPTEIPTDTVAPTEASNPGEIPPGTYAIGTDIKPGIYRGQGDTCYWGRLKDLTGSTDAIIANGIGAGKFYVRVLPSDVGLSLTCPVTLLDPLPKHTGDYPQTLPAGEYLVDVDIQPGTYKGQGDTCYWSRLKDVTGDTEAIIANGIGSGQFYVKVLSSDFALSLTCDVQRTGN